MWEVAAGGEVRSRSGRANRMARADAELSGRHRMRSTSRPSGVSPSSVHVTLLSGVRVRWSVSRPISQRQRDPNHRIKREKRNMCNTHISL